MTVIRVVVMRLTVPSDAGRSTRRVDTPHDTNGPHRQTRRIYEAVASWFCFKVSPEASFHSMRPFLLPPERTLAALDGLSNT
jgi:hypothetical protein